MMKKSKQSTVSENFSATTVKTALGTSIALSFPSIVPASVFGKNAPSNRINVGGYRYRSYITGS